MSLDAPQFSLIRTLATTAFLPLGAALACSTSSAMADGASLSLNDLRYYQADGETETSLQNATFVVIDAYADFAGASDGFSSSSAQLLGMYDCSVDVNGISAFHHSDLSSMNGGGSWDPTRSMDLSTMANSRIDSFLTIGGGVGTSAPVNATVLVGDSSDSDGFIYGDSIAWEDSLPLAMQGMADANRRVFVGRFTLDADEFRACGFMELHGTLEYSYGSGTPIFTAEASASVALLGCPSDPCLGDLNEDGFVNGADLAMLLGGWGKPDDAGDLNGDGSVDGADLAMLLGEWGICS